jgi:hypothetical protein
VAIFAISWSARLHREKGKDQQAGAGGDAATAAAPQPRGVRGCGPMVERRI